MAATAPARRAPARRAPARKAPARRAPAQPHRSRTTVTHPGGMARLPASAVGRTAGAVGGLADSGVVVGLSRTRMWIGLLGILLGGIVALNVWGLGLSASTNGINNEIDALERQNGVLQARVAANGSVERVQKAAAAAGLGVPEARAIRSRRAGDGDIARAADRLSSGSVGAAALAPDATDPSAVDPPAAEVPAPTTSTPEAATPAPETVAPAPAEAAAPPAESAPAAPPTPTAPAEPAAPAPTAGGLAP